MAETCVRCNKTLTENDRFDDGDRMHVCIYGDDSDKLISVKSPLCSRCFQIEAGLVREISSEEWDFVEISFGCSQHNASICTLLRHKTSGEELHIPGKQVSPRG